MEKAIKTILLKNNTILISEIIEIVADIGEPDCKLINPCELSKNSLTDEYVLTVWPDFTYQNEIMVHSDSILTITDPKPTLLEKYIELIA